MKLFLEDGTMIEGESFGAETSASGEVVFNTGMTGYVESISDPSYAGQILVTTYPLIGNYGVPDARFFESPKVQIAGLVVSEYSENYSHQDAVQSLGEWLKKAGVPALTGVDTRALTRKLREHGVMKGQLVASGPKKKFVDPNAENLVARVSNKEKETLGTGSRTVVLVDCGAKENILRSLLARGLRVIRVPWNYDFTKETYDGIVLSNGPGDPTKCTATIAHIKKALGMEKPILGICLGTQLLALAAGAKTYKLKYGHRSHNQPCLDQTSKSRCYITSQNHGYSVDAKTLPSDWSVWFTNANDGSVEGIRHNTLPYRAAQFHPEAAPGPEDTAWIFDDFLRTLKKQKI